MRFRLPASSDSVTLGSSSKSGGLQMTGDDVLAGGVPLAAAIAALRTELMQSWTDGQGKSLRFKVAPVELIVEAAVTWSGKGSAGIKWWLLVASGEVSREKTVTHTIKLTLDPVTLDPNGNVVNVFIDDQDADGSAGARSVTLDDEV
jgi:hypothetical protein